MPVIINMKRKYLIWLTVVRLQPTLQTVFPVVMGLRKYRISLYEDVP